MEQVLINVNDVLFDEVWFLYDQTFPVEEKRCYEKQISLSKNSMYSIDGFFINKKFVGFIMWWQFPLFRYVEHFVICESFRNKGLGADVLGKFINANNDPIVLEVEMPNNSLNKRRISFYERLGFKVNDIEYKQAIYDVNAFDVELVLMSYPSFIPEEIYDYFISDGHNIITK